MLNWCSQAQFFSLEMLKANEVTSLTSQNHHMNLLIQNFFLSFLHKLHAQVYPHSALFFFSQVAVSTNKEVDAHIPNYPSLPPQLICQLHNMTMHVRIAYLF